MQDELINLALNPPSWVVAFATWAAFVGGIVGSFVFGKKVAQRYQILDWPSKLFRRTALFWARFLAARLEVWLDSLRKGTSAAVAASLLFSTLTRTAFICGGMFVGLVAGGEITHGMIITFFVLALGACGYMDGRFDTLTTWMSKPELYTVQTMRRIIPLLKRAGLKTDEQITDWFKGRNDEAYEKLLDVVLHMVRPGN